MSVFDFGCIETQENFCSRLRDYRQGEMITLHEVSFILEAICPWA